MKHWFNHFTKWCRNWKTKRGLDIEGYRELNRLLIKAGRRCAYDLAHASAGQRRVEEGELFHQRSQMWLGIFDAGDDGKNYRDRLHHTIDHLESKVENYRKFLSDKNIDDPFPEEPF